MKSTWPKPKNRFPPLRHECKSTKTTKKKTFPLQSRTKTRSTDDGPGVCILVTEGPCKNTSFTLTKNETPVLVIGSNPTSKSEETFLIQDPSVGANHVRLELVVARKLCTVNVKDLKSSGGTLVNATNVKAGKVQKAFMNDSIHIGDTVLQIKTL